MELTEAAATDLTFAEGRLLCHASSCTLEVLQLMNKSELTFSLQASAAIPRDLKTGSSRSSVRIRMVRHYPTRTYLVLCRA